MQRRLAPSATSAGINADLFTLQTGRPSGIFMRDGELAVAPNAARVERRRPVRRDARHAPRLATRHVGRHGTGACPGPAQRPAGSRRCVRLHSDVRAATPALPGGIAVILFPFPLPSPGVDLPATVVEVRPADAPVGIPPGGAVLLGHGSAGATLTAEAVPGETLTVRLELLPGWAALVSAVGGGPQIVRDGAPVFRAGEKFTSNQLGQRAPRSAVGQRADGRIVLVAVDGRQPGYSVGLTNFELAQALVRLGAVTGMALDGGGSTTMAFDGKLLSRPSGPRERPIASALMFLYTGIFVAHPQPLVSPDQDGVDDTPDALVPCHAPVDGDRHAHRARRHGRVHGDGPARPGRLPGRVPGPRRPTPPPLQRPHEGRWTLKAQASDDLGRTTTMTRTFVVEHHARLRAAPSANVLRLPPKGAELRILWKLARQARVGVTIETPGGTVVRAFPRLLYPAGDASVTWNGLGRDKKAVQGRPIRRARRRRERSRHHRADTPADRPARSGGLRSPSRPSCRDRCRRPAPAVRRPPSPGGFPPRDSRVLRCRSRRS